LSRERQKPSVGVVWAGVGGWAWWAWRRSRSATVAPAPMLARPSSRRKVKTALRAQKSVRNLGTSHTSQAALRTAYLCFGTIVNGNSTRFAVGHTLRSNEFGRAIWDVQHFVPNKVHKHHCIDQGFPPRHRAIHLTSRVSQGSVWRGQLHPWIYVKVGGKS